MKHFVFLVMSLSFALNSQAQRKDPDIEKLKSYTDYYMVSESQSGDINLLRWTHVKHAPNLPKEKYDRIKTFGRFANDPNDGTCMDVRHKVLARDSEIPVKMYAHNKCLVESGKWYDPYTDETYTRAEDLDIDHVVALKHAYLSGGHQWPFTKRCSYANFMANDYHLMTVQDEANVLKSDNPPEIYMPPNTAFHCEFISRWLRIKAAWKLKIFPPEAVKIKEIIEEQSCDADDFMMDRGEFDATQEETEVTVPGCYGKVGKAKPTRR